MKKLTEKEMRELAMSVFNNAMDAVLCDEKTFLVVFPENKDQETEPNKFILDYIPGAGVNILSIAINAKSWSIASSSDGGIQLNFHL